MKPNPLYKLLLKLPIVGSFVHVVEAMRFGQAESTENLPPHLQKICDEVLFNIEPANLDTPAKVSTAIHRIESLFASEEFLRGHNWLKLDAYRLAGGIYLQRYFFDDVDADLDEAMRLWQVAIDYPQTTSIDYPQMTSLDHSASTTLYSRGLLSRYERDNSLDDLNTAIRNFRDVLDAHSSTLGPNRADFADLALALAMRARATQNLTDCAEAMKWAHESRKPTLFDKELRELDEALYEHEYQPDELIAAVVFAMSYELRKHPDDLECAIQILEPMAANKELDWETRSNSQEFLGRCLRERYLRYPLQQDLDRATDLATSVLQNTLGRGARLARRLNLVGLCLHTKFLITHSTADQTQAIEYLQRAVNTARQNSPYRSRYEQDLQIASRAK